jgi:tRNA A-37 threonylcarbamoyl transferase component Bud32
MTTMIQSDNLHMSKELYESMKRILEKLHQAGVHEDVCTVNTMVKQHKFGQVTG